MIDNEDMQQKAMKIQIIEQQMGTIQKQLQNFENQLVDLDVTKEGLSELNKSKLDSEVLSMVSPGIFVKTKLAENDNVIINVGGNVAVKKSVDGAKELIDKQVEEIKKVQLQLISDMQKFETTIMEMSK